MLKWKAMLGVGVFLLGTSLAFAGADIPQVVHTVFPDAKVRVHTEAESMQQYAFIIPAWSCTAGRMCNLRSEQKLTNFELMIKW